MDMLKEKQNGYVLFVDENVSRRRRSVAASVRKNRRVGLLVPWLHPYRFLKVGLSYRYAVRWRCEGWLPVHFVKSR